MGSSSFYSEPVAYDVIDESGDGPGFFDGPAYAAIDPVAIQNLVAVAQAAADAANASKLSSAASATNAATSETNAATSATNAASVASTAATTAVNAAAGTATPLVNGTAAVGAATKWAREDHVHPTDTTRAPVASPAFTGNLTGAGNATFLGTTLITGSGGTGTNVAINYLDGGNGVGAGGITIYRKNFVSTFYVGNHSAIIGTGTSNDYIVYSAGFAGTNITVRVDYTTGVWAFTASPTAPTPTVGDNSAKVATTAFVLANAGTGVGDNKLINPSGLVIQVPTTPAADGGYYFDNWYHLNESNPVAPQQLINAEAGMVTAMRITQSNATAQRFGVAQIVEFADSIDMIGRAITLSARVRMSSSTTLRYAIVEWNGANNSPTRDLVNNWASTTYTAGNFFTATNINVLATGSIGLTANTFANVSLTATGGPDMSNTYVVFWTNSQQAQNITLDIGKVKLELGSVTTPYVARLNAFELRLCQKQLCVISPQSTNGAVACGGISGTTGYFPILFPLPMLFSPSCSMSAASDWSVNPFTSGTTTQPGSSVAFGAVSVNGARVQLTSTTATGGAGGSMGELLANSTSAKIIARAQLGV